MTGWGTREQRTLAALTTTFVALWVLGTVAWRQAEPDLTWPELIYRALQMFSLNFTTPANGVPPLLDVARFAQPTFTILAFAASLSAQLRLALRALFALRREQITILGYGVAGKAAAERFRQRCPDARIVALDRSVSEADQRAARHHGVELIECDVLDKEARKRFVIGIRRSHEIVVACGTDQTNLSLLDELRRELAGLSHAVRLWLHLGSHRLAERLRETYGTSDAAALAVEFVEVADHAAQAVLLTHALVPEARAAGLQRVHVVIHGFDDFSWVCVEQVLLNGIFPAPTLAPPRVTVVTDAADAARAAWQARHPGLEREADVVFVDGGGRAIGWADASDALLQRIEAAEPPTLHIFAGEDSDAALIEALALRDGMRRGARTVAPIVVRSDHRRFTGSDLADTSGVLQLRLTIVDGFDTPASAFGIIGRVLEDRARAFHTAYAAHHAAPAFDRMPHSQRLSNRRAAFHLLEKLRLLGFEQAMPCDATFGIGGDGLAWLRALPATTLEELDRLEHVRWRTDRLIEGWRAGPRNRERRLRDGLQADPRRYAELDAAERSKDRSQLDDFIAQADGGGDGNGTRIAGFEWEGAPPVWSRSPQLALGFSQPIVWPTAGPGAISRLRVLVPPLPPGGSGADSDADEARAALTACGAALLADAPAGSRVRFVRAAAHPWDWLPPDPAGHVDGVTLPRFVVGFAGHRHVERLGDVVALEARLRDELARLVPPGTTLVSGLASGGDTLMVRLWHEMGLGSIVGVVPYQDERGPALEIDAPVDPDLARLCTTVELPPLAADADATERHVAVAETILQRATLLIVVSDGVNGGPGGVEDTVARRRARGGLLRYISTAG
jgi:hypothetical protein